MFVTTMKIGQLTEKDRVGDDQRQVGVNANFERYPFNAPIVLESPLPHACMIPVFAIV